MNRLDFNLLLDLDALLREGSVVGAARVLHLSAPAMSRRLTRLREAIGDPLFVPAGRGLVPTQRALALRERVRAAIEEVRGVFTPDAVDFSRLERTLTLHTNDGFAGAWATRLACAMAAEAPGVSLHFIPRADKSREALRNGAIDLDIGVVKSAEAEIYSEPLFRAAFVGVVRENHPLLSQRTGEAVSAQDFVAWPHISTLPRGSAAGHLDAALKALGLRRRVAIVAPGFQAALAMAATSDFVAAMPMPFVRWAMAHQRLQVFKLPFDMPAVEVLQSWHTRHHADPVHLWLRGHVRAICGMDGEKMPVV
ncbi:LysR family transcriptional regulator [Polaromonas sp. OV174]|uniref:LysR family transcriptional regulator n=1 Tax=Polaromonas sp. OV174 TaxID=1855300 RepID=UPI000B88FC4D|nr:LysR family transcriptional regulator [Polaromonas sp. OV174]